MSSQSTPDSSVYLSMLLISKPLYQRACHWAGLTSPRVRGNQWPHAPVKGMEYFTTLLISCGHLPRKAAGWALESAFTEGAQCH